MAQSQRDDQPDLPEVPLRAPLRRGCAVFADRQYGTLFTNFCDAFSKRFDSIVAEAYAEHAAGVQFVEKLDRACDL